MVFTVWDRFWSTEGEAGIDKEEGIGFQDSQWHEQNHKSWNHASHVQHKADMLGSGRKLPLGELWRTELVEGKGRKLRPQWPRCPAPCSLLPPCDQRILITMICFLDSETLASGTSIFLSPTLLTFLGTRAYHRSQGLQRWKSNSSSPQKFAINLMQRKVSECRHRRKKMEEETTQQWKLSLLLYSVTTLALWVRLVLFPF